mmetsp:Transcript_129865/g.376004  ORF Transcript_129865/g.376004 Transcript_129865/m.376004 type:complete len:603 (+) Transcript_129865:95-1903(+)|eukprot:CAMPEP_0176154190 /NCGR_PEP_ID=MMETSP0120_2-20121206/78773_1 /TAXON_ID=160619 /ORGANISM="Kryptoperidinium foliaceum, Strain CCMP 1326" /LENGTH=602 /DNA_ID=CAMNT_0017491279 /DNA_START=56 /DNA_END=1864 /DNA_ORIENTATION=-
MPDASGEALADDARPPPAATDGGAPEERACRYCFEGEESGTLISPCRCAGGQKWVHLSCLRRWQRGVLVSQPTHPDLYDDDIRHRVCNVCKAPYTCRPPTRLELMQSFTGAELAALVDIGCVIGASQGFSQELQRQVGALPEPLKEAIVETNWIDGAFLIVQVVEDKDAVVHLRIHTNDDFEEFVSQLTEDWCWQMRGRSMRLLFVDRLQGAADAGVPREQTLKAIRGLAEHRLPLTLKLEAVDGTDCGEDGVVAVNLTQPIEIATGMGHVRRRHRFQAAVAKALPEGKTFKGVGVEVRHFRGGPCQKDSVAAALVISDPSVYETHFALTTALSRAYELAGSATLGHHDGDEVRGESAPSAKRLRTESGAAVSSTAPPGSEGGAMPSSSPSPSASAPAHPIRVHVFWGSAGWSRCQLMGEIASGSWGLCKVTPQDVVRLQPEAVYDAIYPRLVFAPKTEMSETYAQDSTVAEEEQANRARLQVLRRRYRRREEEARRLQARLEQVDQVEHSVQEGVRQREVEAGEVIRQLLVDEGLVADEEEPEVATEDWRAVARRLMLASEMDSDEDCMEDIDAEDGEEEEGASQEDCEEEAQEEDSLCEG